MSDLEKVGLLFVIIGWNFATANSGFWSLLFSLVAVIGGLIFQLSGNRTTH